MRVAWLEIQNFRSIKHLRLEGLDKPQVVLEGPNDVGKSNILHALDLALSALPSRLRQNAAISKPIPGEPSAYPFWARRGIENLFRSGEASLTVKVGIRFDREDGKQGWQPDPAQVFDFDLQWKRENFEPVLQADVSLQGAAREVYEGMARALAPAFRIVTTERSPRSEHFRVNSESPPESLLRWEGSNLKSMLFFYKNSPQMEIQERFDQLRTAVRDPEMGIGILNVSVDTHQNINVKTLHQGLEVSLDERGSGIQQLLTLLTLSLCHRGKILAIEEPEMNLSEPNQRRLWKKLREFSSPGGPLDQVFVTSHSRVFEEEAERLVVSKDPEQGTSAHWAEPAPARKSPEHEALSVTRGGGVTLPPEVLQRLGIQEGKHLYLVSSDHGYQLLGPQGYADLLREEDSDAGSTG